MPDEQENNRNPDGTFKKGHSGNPNGRPTNTLKAFLAREFREMEDWEKREWLKENNVSGEVMWKMAEGNPSNQTDITSDGQPINFVVPGEIADKNKLND